MTPAFRIILPVLIGYTLLFYFYPNIAILFICPVASLFFFYIAFDGVRNGFITANAWFRTATYYRNREPFFFWSAIFVLFL
jgi:hypothetical protein